MANVATSRSKSKAKKQIKVKILPATDNSRKLNFAKVNGKIIPYDIPTIIDENDLKVLKGLKEPTRQDGSINIGNIMDDLQITQEKANKIARMSETKDMTSRVKFINKYFVQIL